MYREKGKERENDVETELKVAVCDDSQADRNILSQLVKKTADDMGIPVHIQEYASGENLMEDILSEHDILFLDIQMEGMDGQETAFAFRSQNRNAVLVFVTGVAVPTPEMFKVYPYRYLLKQELLSKGREDMSAILKKAAERKKHVYLTAFYKGKMMQLDTDRILYISLKKRGCQIWLNQEKEESPINCNSRLADIYAGLEMHNFAYAHNSYVVNLKYVAKVEGNLLVLMDGTALTISRSRKEEFHKAFARYLGNKYPKKQYDV